MPTQPKDFEEWVILILEEEAAHRRFLRGIRNGLIIEAIIFGPPIIAVWWWFYG